MGLLGGGALRLFETFLYALELCCSAIILGIYSYFLAVLHHRSDSIPRYEKAIEGISGAACLYLICAVVLTCFLGGITFFAFIAIVLDICFVGGFIAIAIMARHGAHSCSGNVDSPLGNGAYGAGGKGYGTTYGRACKLNTAVFAVSVIGAVLFCITALVQLALVRHHKKEKAFGPSPANNYTSGSGNRKFWQKRDRTVVVEPSYKEDAELGVIAGGAAGLAAHHNDDFRPSHDTAYTGSTVAAPYQAIKGEGIQTLFNNGQVAAAQHTNAGYYSQPQGTGINPYGYDNTKTTGTAANF